MVRDRVVEADGVLAADDDVPRSSRLRGPSLQVPFSPAARSIGAVVVVGSLRPGTYHVDPDGVVVGKGEVVTSERGELTPAQSGGQCDVDEQVDVASQAGAQQCPFAVLEEPDLRPILGLWWPL